MRKQKCSSCGCTRVLLIKAKVKNQQEKFQVGLKPLCVSCFLDVLRVPRDQMEKLSEYKYWRECL